MTKTEGLFESFKTHCSDDNELADSPFIFDIGISKDLTKALVFYIKTIETIRAFKASKFGYVYNYEIATFEQIAEDFAADIFKYEAKKIFPDENSNEYRLFIKNSSIGKENLRLQIIEHKPTFTDDAAHILDYFIQANLDDFPGFSEKELCGFLLAILLCYKDIALKSILDLVSDESQVTMLSDKYNLAISGSEK